MSNEIGNHQCFCTTCIWCSSLLLMWWVFSLSKLTAPASVYCYIQAHARTHTHSLSISICISGQSGNELADKLAKEAIKNSEVCYNKIPKSEIERQEAENTIAKWQLQWDDTAKGRTTKEYFPDFKERLKMKLRLSPNLTAVLTAHGKPKAYLHRFKIIQSPECICKQGDQTMDHLMHDCETLDKQREKLTAHTSREEDWPVRICELVKKYVKQFTTSANSIDFGKLKWKGRKAKAKKSKKRKSPP